MTTNPEVLRIARADWNLIREYIDAKIAYELSLYPDHHDIGGAIRLGFAEGAIDNHLRQGEKDNSDAD